MPMLESTVNLTGKILSIDLDKRDITVATDIPNHRQEVVCHLWTTLEDSHGTWRSPDNWKSYLAAGIRISAEGHLGNNGRVIVTPGNIQVLCRNTADTDRNIVQCTAVKAGSSKCLTKTKIGKDVLVELTGDALEDIEDGKTIAFIGIKEKNNVKVVYLQEVTERTDSRNG